MRHEVRVEQDFWTTGRSETSSDDEITTMPDDRTGPLFEALEVARSRQVLDYPPRTSRTSGDSVVIDLRLAEDALTDSGRVEPTRDDTRPRVGAGDLWRQSVQGWVKGPDGNPEWRPIVTTTTEVPNWAVDVNLGMVTGESACAVETRGLGSLVSSERGKDALRHVLAKDRRVAEEAMVDEAVARGAHAVIGVKLDYTYLGECLIVTSTGTAVTLRARA